MSFIALLWCAKSSYRLYEHSIPSQMSHAYRDIDLGWFAQPTFGTNQDQAPA